MRGFRAKYADIVCLIALPFSVLGLIIIKHY